MPKDDPVHAVRLDRSEDGTTWRFWCLCGATGTPQLTLQAAERQSWKHLQIAPTGKPRPVRSPRLPKGPR